MPFLDIEFPLVAQVGFMETEVVVENGDDVTFTLSTSTPSSHDIIVDIHCSPINSRGIVVTIKFLES